jgi:hypothetical protein
LFRRFIKPVGSCMKNTPNKLSAKPKKMAVISKLTRGFEASLFLPSFRHLIFGMAVAEELAIPWRKRHTLCAATLYGDGRPCPIEVSRRSPLHGRRFELAYV